MVPELLPLISDGDECLFWDARCCGETCYLNENHIERKSQDKSDSSFHVVPAKRSLTPISKFGFTLVLGHICNIYNNIH